MDIRQHLRSRGMDPERPGVLLDEQKGIATFLIYNLMGQIVGYQQYNPNTTFKTHVDCESRRDEIRYYTFAGHEGDSNKGRRRLLVWGLESLEPGQSVVYVAEGVFDAVKLQNVGLPAVAVLANDPYPLRPLFRALGRIVIAVLDDDGAGSKLAKFADRAVVVPAPYHDLGEMPQDEVRSWMGKLGLLP